MSYSLLSEKEIAVGRAVIQDPRFPPRRIQPVAVAPSDQLATVLLRSMRRSRIAVAFSGGVDSSGLLCLATDLARQHGLDEPVPITVRFNDAPSASEDEWQEEVVRHLRLSDWTRVHVRDEADCLGPIATAGLLRHGIRWPTLLHTDEIRMRHSDGLIYVTGNGGDELTWPTRAGVVQALRHRMITPSREAMRAAVADLRPRLTRLRRVAVPAWIRPAARDEIIAMLRRDRQVDSFRWRRTIEARTNAPWSLRGHPGVIELGRELGIEVVEPLTDLDVIGSMLHAGGRTGFADRSVAARKLFGDNLPRSIAVRRDKAHFNEVIFRSHSREFLRRWDGQGLPEHLVDSAVLRRLWTSERPPPTTFPLLQLAWLNSQ